MKAKLSASKMFIPASLKMSPEYEAQVKHFKEVTQHKILAKYGVGAGVKEKAIAQLPTNLQPPKLVKQKTKQKTVRVLRDPKQEMLLSKIKKDLNFA
jgi:hypothetical protein